MSISSLLQIELDASLAGPRLFRPRLARMAGASGSELCAEAVYRGLRDADRVLGAVACSCD